jgi:hypothetical protein
MRTSSMKSRTAIATLVMTLTFAVPHLDAKPAQPRQTRSAFTIVTQLIQRYLGIKCTGDIPENPIPIAPTDPAVSTKGTVLR